MKPAPLSLNVQWRADHGWFSLHASSGPGLTLVAGPAAPDLLRLLAGHAIPHRGTVLLDDRPVAHGSAVTTTGPHVRPVAAVFTGDPLSAWRTPLAVVRGALRRHGVPWHGASARAVQALGWMDAAHLAHRLIAQLSGTDRQRVALARALAVLPGLLLLDRPGAPFSAPERRRLYGTLGHLAVAWEMVVLVRPDPDADLALPVLRPLAVE